MLWSVYEHVTRLPKARTDPARYLGVLAEPGVERVVLPGLERKLDQGGHPTGIKRLQVALHMWYN